MAELINTRTTQTSTHSFHALYATASMRYLGKVPRMIMRQIHTKKIFIRNIRVNITLRIYNKI